MATAKKLPSGSWRVLVYSHKDSKGKRVYESFTAPSKSEAEMLAAQYKAKKRHKVKHDITVGDAIEQYITSKQGVLSTSTITSYRSMQRRFFDDIHSMRLSKLSAVDVQEWVSGLSASLSPKTVKNAYSLLTASLRLSNASLSLDGITLPSRVKKRPSAPSDDDIALLYAHANQRMKLAIVLAAFGSMRRGEVCALKFRDVVGRKAFIHADLVINENKGWVYKDYPKTSDSIRYVILPDEVIDMIGSGDPNDYVVGYTPSGLSKTYERLQKRIGTSIRFHDLRHYYASIGAVLHIPDVYLASFGGWKQNSTVMKEVYQNPIIPVADGYGKKMSDHFSSILKNAT